jgi:hypothetical protein
MLLSETHGKSRFSYNISPNGVADDWYWEVSCGGYIVARGLAATRKQARADAKGAVVGGSHVQPLVNSEMGQVCPTQAMGK